MKRGVVWSAVFVVLGVGGAGVFAESFNSTNFSVNGSLGDSIAGGQSSTSYKMTSGGGASIGGNSSSTSYKLGQGYVPQLEANANSLQLVVQPNGLVGYWPLDNSAGGATAFDESANSNNGVYSANSGSIAGKVGNAWSDFGGLESISIPHHGSLTMTNKMTISGWIYNAGTTTQRGIMNKWAYDPNSGSWAFQTTPGATNLRMFIKDVSDPGNNFVDSTNASMALSTWYHVAVVYDGAQAANSDRVKIYLNGTQLSTTVTGTIEQTMQASSHSVVIGDFPGLNRGWSGYIDEAKLYGKALTTSEVAADYSATNVGIPAGVAFSNSITAGQSQTSSLDAIVQTNAPGYTLAINQNNNLTNGGNTISGVSGSIGSPVTWSEGSTKGLGFTLYGTTGTAIPGTWGSGGAYAAIPGSGTTFYTRTGTPSAKDVLNMRLRLDVPTIQAVGGYTNQAVITGTMTP